MEFIYLIRDMPIYVTCKFEMLIFKGSQVIRYYVMFAFLFVETVNKQLHCCHYTKFTQVLTQVLIDSY